jgi:hypothetical protein
MTLFKKIDKDNPAISTMLFLLCITLLGTFLRFLYLQKSDFIMNDGGMFYTMILDLEKNGFTLPFYTSYNLSQIPYAYPPLSFYTGAFLHQILHINLVTVFRFYPLFFNVLSIPAFFFLAHEITLNNRQSLLATAFYAMLLPGYEWLISGGGLTRSPAHTLFIIAFFLFLSYLRTKKKKYLILSIIAAILMSYHHLEYCWILAFSIAVYTLNNVSIKECIKLGAIYAGSVALFTLPYWGTIIFRHGITTFLSAFLTGDYSLNNSIIRLIIMRFTDETMINFVNVLAIIGLLYCLFSRKYRLIIWFLLLDFLYPRIANRSLIFPVVIFAAIVIDELICPALEKLYTSQRSTDVSLLEIKKNHPFIPSNFAYLFIAFSIIYPFFLCFLNTFIDNPVLSTISKAEQDAMKWVEVNTPHESKFVIMTQTDVWSMDKIGEWFPTLSERKSLTTIQGSEWLPNSEYIKSKDNFKDYKKCLKTDESCFSSWAMNNHVEFTHVYLVKSENSQDSTTCLTPFSNFFKNSTYQKIYENEEVIIFEK